MIPDDILMNVARPGRYTGGEWNAVKKGLSKVKLSTCLCFPEVYEIGMSHLGIRILYDILNSKDDVLCERAFCPWPDFGKKLSENHLELYSLESKIPLKDFDLLGFSINNELNYTNILSMLFLSNIPFLSKDRPENFPLIIGGGSCVLNPEPIADFFDLFVIGEAEEVIIEIVEICKKFKQKYQHICYKKEDLLMELSQIPGVYVPQFYNPEYDFDAALKEFSPLRKNIPSIIKKVYIKDLNCNLRPLDWVVPNIEIIHDRIGIEIMRGCVHQCRFCQARSSFYPLRIRSAENIVSLSKELYKTSGYEEISLLSLSSSEHPQIGEIVKSLLGYFKQKAVSIALPSMRVKNTASYILELFSLQRKTGLTFAPEAGTEKLRKIINKDINIDDLFGIAKDAFKAGYRRIKLYFMIGLPKEDYQDLDAIIDISHKLSYLRKELCGRAAEINISIATLIPKPHTPFQWLSMLKIEDIIQKQEYLKKTIRQNRHLSNCLKISFHDAYMSQLESALSRGHRLLSKIIIDAFNNGAQFDQWKEYFNFDNWRSCFSRNGLDIGDFTARPLKLEKTLAWDFISTGIEKQYLVAEFQKALT